MPRLPILVLTALAVSGCAQVLGLDAVSVVTTDKLIEDHIISWGSGKDCSAVRLERGQTYCVEDEPHPQPKVFCYKTLGDVVCYDRPDPHHNGHQQLGENQHNLAR